MGSAIFRNYLTSSIWVAPSGSAITASCWGGGGGGQDTDIAIPANGVGGGGGSYARKILTVVSGSSYIVTVGAGGPAKNNGLTSPGGDSWFSGSTIVRAKGGNSAATNIGDVTYTGGAAGIGGGGGAGSTGNGGGGSGLTGGTGTAVSGGNGGTTPGTNTSGRTGSLYGGGGSGGTTTGTVDHSGDNGAQGVVILEYPGSSSLEQFILSTTWVCPQGVSFVTASCWGGGGNAGYGTTSGDGVSDFGDGGGGGGGAFARKVIPVTPGNAYTVTVGDIAGDSWFSSSVAVLAKGGTSGTNASCTLTACSNGTNGVGGSAASSIGDIKYSGGNGNTAGGGGAGSQGSGSISVNQTTGGSKGAGLYGGNGGNATDSAGSLLQRNAIYFGGGGGGGLGSNGFVDGGSGRQGLIILEYTPIIQSAVAGAFFNIL
jgi:hypothetical protein